MHSTLSITLAAFWIVVKLKPKTHLKSNCIVCEIRAARVASLPVQNAAWNSIPFGDRERERKSGRSRGRQTIFICAPNWHWIRPFLRLVCLPHSSANSFLLAWLRLCSCRWHNKANYHKNAQRTGKNNLYLHTHSHTRRYTRAATGKPIQMAESLNLEDFCVGSSEEQQQ